MPSLRHGRNGEYSGLVRHRLPHVAGLFIQELDGGAGKRQLLLIANDASDGANRALGVGIGSSEKQERQDQESDRRDSSFTSGPLQRA